MSTLETNAIGKYSGNNVSVDDSLNLKSYSTSARNALTSVAGDMIVNSTTNRVQAYNGSSWESLGLDTSSFTIHYLVIAGGGSGGADGGGGGAGGYRNSYNSETSGGGGSSETSLTLNKNTNYTLFTNAKIHSSHKNIIDGGSMLIKDGKIISVGKTVDIPENSIIINLKGKSIYPSFIDIYSKFGIKPPDRNSSGRRSPQYNNTRDGYYWNDHIRPEQNAIDFFKYDEKSAN